MPLHHLEMACRASLGFILKPGLARISLVSPTRLISAGPSRCLYIASSGLNCERDSGVAVRRRLTETMASAGMTRVFACVDGYMLRLTSPLSGSSFFLFSQHTPRTLALLQSCCSASCIPFTSNCSIPIGPVTPNGRLGLPTPSLLAPISRVNGRAQTPNII